MSEEDYTNLKDEKELKDSELNENESGNSLENLENDNDEYFSAGPPNLDISNKIESDEGRYHCLHDNHRGHVYLTAGSNHR